MNLRIFEKILPYEEEIFYGYFKESAEICNESALLLLKLIEEGHNTDIDVRFKQLKNISNKATKEILTLLDQTFLSPLDKDHLLTIIMSLNKIVKGIIKISHEKEITRLALDDNNIEKAAGMIIRIAKELIFIINLLQKPNRTRWAVQSHKRMRALEDSADEILNNALDDLTSEKYSRETINKLENIYNLLEKTIKDCFCASDEVISIILKHT